MYLDDDDIGFVSVLNMASYFLKSVILKNKH